jgi:hypothetical protein
VDSARFVDEPAAVRGMSPAQRKLILFLSRPGMAPAKLGGPGRAWNTARWLEAVHLVTIEAFMVDLTEDGRKAARILRASPWTRPSEYGSI